MSGISNAKIIGLAVLGLAAIYFVREWPDGLDWTPQPELQFTTCRQLKPGEYTRPDPSLNRYSTAAGGINTLDCTAAAGVVHVVADSQLFDRRPRAQYVWSIEIFDAQQDTSTTPLYQRIYDNQVFAPGSEYKHFSFEDLVVPELPAGDYQLKLKLSIVKSDAGFTPGQRLVQNQIANRSSSTRRVSIN